MPRILIKSRLHSDKHKSKIKQEPKNTKSTLPQNLQSFKQKLLSGNGFFWNIYELRRFSFIR